jgi:hypothetical protein
LRLLVGAATDRCVHGRPWLLLALFFLTGCHSGGGDLPPWWWKHPIRRSLYCSNFHPGALKPGGKRPPAEIQRVVRGEYGAIGECYNALLARNRVARGLLQTRFIITPEGTVSNACVSVATLDDDVAAECMLDAFSRLNFGPAKGSVVVVYPIRFEPAQSASSL